MNATQLLLRFDACLLLFRSARLLILTALTAASLIIDLHFQVAKIGTE